MTARSRNTTRYLGKLTPAQLDAAADQPGTGWLGATRIRVPLTVVPDPADLAATLEAATTARPAEPACTLPGLEPGHRYAYTGPGMAGMVYVAPDGTLTLKPGGVAASRAERARDHLTFTHMTHDCHGCGTTGGPTT